MPKRTDITSYQFFQRLKALPFVEAIYLYGSRARGEADEWSDIDLAIATPSADASHWAQVLDIVESPDILVPVQCIRLEDVKNGVFRDEIERDKKLLYRRTEHE